MTMSDQAEWISSQDDVTAIGDLEQQSIIKQKSEQSSDTNEDTIGLISGTSSQQRRGLCTKTISIAICAILIAAVCIGAILGTSIITKPPPTAGDDHLAEEDLSIKSNDYILDPDWDFQAVTQRREYTWTIRDQKHNPDGIYRPMILVNNQFPGPLIEVNEDDTIVVHVHNRASNATSIHWHGLYQNGTNHMDGTVGVTQCPIAPGANFTYEFRAVGQSGTYWWHAHQGVQSSDGVHGPLIIHSREEERMRANDYTSDRVLLVADHYHDLSSALLWQYLKPDNENAEPVPQSGLINGRNIRNCDDFHDRHCDNSSAHVGQATLDLAAKQNHRLRLINVGAFAEFQVQIDEHELYVTEVDGTDVHSSTSYHRININPAQRYSVVVHTTSESADSFWLRARMVTKCFTDPPKTLDSEVRAIVRYHSSASAVPTSTDWEEALESACRDMNTTDLKPVQQIAAPSQADTFYYLRSNFEIGAYRLSRGVFNATSFRPNVRSPTLHRAMDGLNQANASFTASSSSGSWVNDQAFDITRELVIQTTTTQTIDLLISNFDDGNHPLHLHGYKYFVLAQGRGYPPMKEPGVMTLENLEPLYTTLDLSNPLRRDTASVEAFGWILIRLVTDNPGAWAFHCHLSWHSEAGLLMQFLTRTDDLARMDVPEANRALCLDQGIEKGMGPDDEVYKEIAK